MDDLLNEFLTETAESIDVVDVELVKLEQDPGNKGVIDNIFRLVHTIKGTCGFLGLPRLEAVAHSSENVLGKFRDGELEVTPDCVTVVLESLDRIKSILAGLEKTEQEPAGDDSELIGRLDAIAGGEVAVARKAAPAKPAEQPVEDMPELGRPLKPGEVSLDELERVFNEAPGPGQPEAGQAPAARKDNLFDRIGGADTVVVAAHLLANRLGRNGKLASFFADKPEEVRKAKCSGLLTALLKEDDEVARTVIASLVDRPGFLDAHFDALLAELGSVFQEIRVEDDLREDAVMAFELVRAATLEASAQTATGPATSGGAVSRDRDGTEAAGNSERRSGQSIRVSVDLLEDLMNMVSELVLTRNQLLQMVREREDSEFTVPIQRLSQTTTELQEGVMKTRMQPIGNAWAKLPRIVRDLAVELDKKIELEMKGSETELDRQVLELIKDPLTHMVRNSADHGIETPAERLAMGKPETGTVRLNAYHEGGHIIIEIKDDGRGISPSKLRKKALEKGLASEAELAEMSEAQIQKFIFHPGFSTAVAVTAVSGRGVGMDVVRTNIEKIGGAIDMTSTEGKGTGFLIKIPLTLAIVSSLIVEASGERFAIPQISVLELVRTNATSDYRIEKIKDTPVLRLRNRLLPLIHLNTVLGFSEDGREATGNEDDFIIVTQVGASTFGIVVDAVFDTEEIVVKPVAPILKSLSIYSGNTILGDGSVIMILDPNGIAEAAHAGIAEEEDTGAVAEQAVRQRDSGRESMLLFRTGAKGRKAVPLGLVARLEDIEVERIEEADGRNVVQYRGSLVPIVLAQGVESLREEGRQPVLVFTDGDRTMGLAVSEILDIVEEVLEVRIASDKPGMVGSAVVDGKATEIIDVAHYLGLAFDDWMRSRDQLEDLAPERGTRVLLVDDSAFFRNMLKPLLAAAGYRVICVETAKEALELREEGETFDLIVSDIEMPGMDGFEFAHILKRGGRWSEVPLVALSSHASSKHLDRGRQVGFNDYVAKFDRKALLASLSQQLRSQGDAA